MVAPSPALDAAPLDAATPEDEAWRIPKQRGPLTWLVVAGAIALLGGAAFLAREVLVDRPTQGATLPVPVATEQLPSTAVTAPPASSPAASASAKVSLTNAESETKAQAEARARDDEAAAAKARADAEAAKPAPVVPPPIQPPAQPQQRPAQTPQGSQGNPRPRKSTYDPMGI
jgi:hypothetical protein